MSKKWIYALVGLQTIAMAASVGWWLTRRPDRTNDGGFRRLLQHVRSEGAPAGLVRIGRDVVTAGVEACHFDACIAALFNGDVGHYRRATRQTKTDRCAGYLQEECTPARARRAIVETLKRAAIFLQCKGQPLRRVAPNQATVDIVCTDEKDPSHTVFDQVTLRATVSGAWLFEGVDRFPGFLPAIYADLMTDPVEEPPTPPQ
jgi:hypothetical protein